MARSSADRGYEHGWPAAIGGRRGMWCPSAGALCGRAQLWRTPVDRPSRGCHAVPSVARSLLVGVGIWKENRLCLIERHHFLSADIALSTEGMCHFHGERIETPEF